MSRLNNDKSDREQTVRNFLRDCLGTPKDGQNIQKILSGTGSCYDADRAYIFEFNTTHTEFSNTYEWCKEGVAAEKDNLQNITVDGSENWFDELEKKGEFIISSLSEEYDADSKLYRLLQPQGIESLAKVITDLYGRKFAIGNYDANIQLYIENEVLEEDRQLFDCVRTTEEANRFLSDKTAYSFTYRVFRDDRVQYFECRLVKPMGNRSEFVIAFKNIDDEKNCEFAQQRKIEAALDEVRKINRTLQYEMNIAGALGKDYPNVVLLDPANDTVMTIKRNGIILKEDERTVRYSYDKLCDDFISKYVHTEDRERVRAAFSMDSVLHALETDDEYMFSYRTIYDHTGIHNYQASFFRIYRTAVP